LPRDLGISERTQSLFRKKENTSMAVDYLFNGKASGSVASRLLHNGFDVGAMRPYVGKNGHSFVTLRDGEEEDEKGNMKTKYKVVPLANASAALLREEWKYIDRAVVEAARPRLRAWADLRRSSSLVIPGGMSKTIVESMRVKDITPAKISMDGVAISDSDVPEGDTIGVPLPIIHKDCKISARVLAVSRNGALPLDTTFVSLAARKVAEEVEKMTIGIGAGAGYQYGGYTIHGYTSFPDRITYELTNPTDGGWTPKVLVQEVIGMRKAAEDVGFDGPFVMYISADWSALLDEDYSDVKGSNTIRQRILALDNISTIRTLDYLEGYQILLVQLTPDVARAIEGMPLTTLQWEHQGGMEICLKVMAIMVPQLRADYYNGTGIVHGNVPIST
jgi:uncharacterized linocin/CFP29 family protein